MFNIIYCIFEMICFLCMFNIIYVGLAVCNLMQAKDVFLCMFNIIYAGY